MLGHWSGRARATFESGTVVGLTTPRPLVSRTWTRSGALRLSWRLCGLWWFDRRASFRNQPLREQVTERSSGPRLHRIAPHRREDGVAGDKRFRQALSPSGAAARWRTIPSPGSAGRPIQMRLPRSVTGRGRGSRMPRSWNSDVSPPGVSGGGAVGIFDTFRRYDGEDGPSCQRVTARTPIARSPQAARLRNE